jgi:hypothetical protein
VAACRPWRHFSPSRTSRFVAMWACPSTCICGRREPTECCAVGGSTTAGFGQRADAWARSRPQHRSRRHEPGFFCLLVNT